MFKKFGSKMNLKNNIKLDKLKNCRKKLIQLKQCKLLSISYENMDKKKYFQEFPNEKFK